MNKIRLGLIGLGYIGKVHLRNCLKLDTAELVGVADISKKALSIAKSMGVKKTYNDYKDLLANDNIDAVIIALPTHLHLRCATEAAKSGKHIFLEKPLAKNATEGKEILYAADKNNVELMVGYPFRFASSFRALKEGIDRFEFGEIPLAYATNISTGPFFHRHEGDAPRPIPDWWFNTDLTGGGALIDLGSHMINLARWYFGEVKNVTAYLGHKLGFDFEDHASCVVQFESGTTTNINVGWYSQKTTLAFEIFGTVDHGAAHHTPPHKIITAIQLMLRRTPKFFMPHFDELEYFVNCLQSGEKSSESGEEALKDMEVIDQAYKNSVHLESS